MKRIKIALLATVMVLTLSRGIMADSTGKGDLPLKETVVKGDLTTHNEQIARSGGDVVKVDFLEQVPKWQQEFNVPAVGIGLIEAGKIKQVSVIGELRKGHPAPLNAIFNVASLTKPVTAMVTLVLVSKGLWNLDEPLFKYWVDPDVANDPRHKLLTTRHVLTHHTGFVNWRWLHQTKKLTFDYEPGAHYGYSGEGFEYLRKALEIKFKKPLNELAKSEVLAPLGLADTRYTWDDSMTETRFAFEHDKKGDEYDLWKRGTACGSDDLLTTVTDYCTFAVETMKGTLLSPAVFEDMIRPQALVKGDNFFGLGWLIATKLSHDDFAMVHSGSDQGVNTIVLLLPKSKRGLVVFTNGDNGREIVQRILTQVFDNGEEIWSRIK